MTPAEFRRLYAKSAPTAANLSASEYQAQHGGKVRPQGQKSREKKQSESQQQSGKMLIGIDPGSVVTGFACIPETGPPVLMGFKSHCAAILHVLTLVQVVGSQNVHVVIEDARKVAKNAWFAKKNGHSKDKGAGYVSALSKDWEFFCRDVAKVSYTMQAPNPARTKWTAEQFEKVTGIKTKKSEHHARDAYLLVYPI